MTHVEGLVVGSPNFALHKDTFRFDDVSAGEKACKWMSFALIDNHGFSRNCWATVDLYFFIESVPPDDPLERYYRAQESIWSHLPQNQSDWSEKNEADAWLVSANPEKMAYATAIWSDDYVDDAMAWATSLIETGSVFPRVCMVWREQMTASILGLLQNCCCELIGVDPIRSPVAVLEGENHQKRYEYVLTKLRVYQLGLRGYKKIVFMDADTLVYQNIDELFWTPAPAFTLLPASLMGERSVANISTGVMVIEPDEDEFHEILDRLWAWEEEAKKHPPELDGRGNKKDVFQFIEQDLLDIHYEARGGPGLQGDGRGYNILPMSYNVYPELLKQLPFLAEVQYQDFAQDEKEYLSFPDRHDEMFCNGTGIFAEEMDEILNPKTSVTKVVHFWSRYNPIHVGPVQIGMQRVAQFRQPQMAAWYHYWWRMHQLGLKRGLSEAPWDYNVLRQMCVERNIAKFGICTGRISAIWVAGGLFRCKTITGYMDEKTMKITNASECPDEWIMVDKFMTEEHGMLPGMYERWMEQSNIQEPVPDF